VLRLKAEMDAERQMLTDKRDQEKMYLKKMMEENARNKANKMQVLEGERLEDVQA
jgi:hypothetical protein